jgi:hypothetical protein
VFPPTFFVSVDQIKKYKMGAECSTCREESKGTEGFVGGKVTDIADFEKVGVDGRIIVIGILKR